VAAERKAGSNQGRATIDWQQAFLYYAALPPDQRDYNAVADRFKVSVRTVEKHGLKERWRDRTQAIDAEAASAAAATLAKERATQLAQVDKLIDASYLTYANQLRDGRVRVTPADLPRLQKLRRELWDDPARDPPPATTPAPAPATTTEEKLAHKLAVLRALRDAGALERLQQLADTPDPATGGETQ
jgi:hypothetical protein